MWSNSHTLCCLQRNGKHIPFHSNTKFCTQMFVAALFITAQNLEAIKCPLIDEWLNKSWYLKDNGILFSTKMNYPLMNRLERTLSVYYRVKEDTLNRLHNVCFQLYSILEKKKQWRWWKAQLLPGERWWVVGLKRWSTEDFYTGKIWWMIP